MFKKAASAILLFVASSAFAALPTPSEIPKEGDCPAEYSGKGNQCVPAAQARYAFAKSGDCPEAYETQGSYCVATASAKLAIRKAAMSCPSGFTEVGSYCVSEK